MQHFDSCNANKCGHICSIKKRKSDVWNLDTLITDYSSFPEKKMVLLIKTDQVEQ